MHIPKHKRRSNLVARHRKPRHGIIYGNAQYIENGGIRLCRNCRKESEYILLVSHFRFQGGVSANLGVQFPPVKGGSQVDSALDVFGE